MRQELEKYSNSELRSYFSELYQSVGNSGHISDTNTISNNKNEYDEQGNPNSIRLIEEINQGSALLLYAGHANEVAFSTTNFDISSVDQLTNVDNYFLGCVVGCSISSHDEEYMSLAEYLQVASKNNEPIGSIGIFGSTILQSWSAPMIMQRKLNDTIINANSVMTLGEIFKEAVLVPQFINSGDFWFYHLLGDPVTRYVLTLPELRVSSPEPEPIKEPEPEPIIEPEPQPIFLI